MLQGRKLKEEPVEKIITEVARFMESCLEEWLEHIKQKRKTYIYLNYFTVDQLVILQQELVKMGSEDQPSKHIYPLLSAVKANCKPGRVEYLNIVSHIHILNISLCLKCCDNVSPDVDFMRIKLHLNNLFVLVFEYKVDHRKQIQRVLSLPKQTESLVVIDSMKKQTCYYTVSE